MSDTDDCIAYLALAVCVLRKKRRRRRNRKIWMQEWLKNRNQFAENNISKSLIAHRKFKNIMTEDVFHELLEMITPFIVKKNTLMRDAIPPIERLSATLEFLTTGLSFQDLKYLTSISQSTLSIIVVETCEALIKCLDNYAELPQTPEEWNIVVNGFEERWKYPNCLGVIHGKHIKIKKPQASGSQYLNYKSFYSVPLLAVIDSNYEFLSVELVENGNLSDAHVLGHSNFGKALYEKALNIPDNEDFNSSQQYLPYVFLGDESFSLIENCMTPYQQTDLTRTQRVYNYRHQQAYQVAENTFGVLISKFNVFKTVLQFSFEKISPILIAACKLHNFLKRTNISHYMPEGMIDIEDNGKGTIIKGSWRENDNLISLERNLAYDFSEESEFIRDSFAHYFANQG